MQPDVRISTTWSSFPQVCQLLTRTSVAATRCHAIEKPNRGAGVQVFEELAKLEEPDLEAHMKRIEADRPNE